MTELMGIRVVTQWFPICLDAPTGARFFFFLRQNSPSGEIARGNSNLNSYYYK